MEIDILKLGRERTHKHLNSHHYQEHTEAMFILTLHGIVLIGWFEDFLYLVTISFALAWPS